MQMSSLLCSTMPCKRRVLFSQLRMSVDTVSTRSWSKGSRLSSLTQGVPSFSVASNTVCRGFPERSTS